MLGMEILLRLTLIAVLSGKYSEKILKEEEEEKNILNLYGVLLASYFFCLLFSFIFSLFLFSFHKIV